MSIAETERKLATTNGFECLEDARRGAGWNRFKKDTLHIWAIREGWMTAHLVDHHYCQHQSFTTLEDAFNRNG